ncbi:hypothetical protein KIPB_015455, partial [Kipferlia bialata]
SAKASSRRSGTPRASSPTGTSTRVRPGSARRVSTGSARVSRPKPRQTDSDDKEFRAFLARQDACLRKKNNLTLRSQQVSADASFRPKINSRSRALVAQTRPASLEQRSAASVAQKKEREREREAQKMAENTFKPQINARSRRLKARSADEMNRDLDRAREKRSVLQQRLSRQ